MSVEADNISKLDADAGSTKSQFLALKSGNIMDIDLAIGDDDSDEEDDEMDQDEDESDATDQDVDEMEED